MAKILFSVLYLVGAHQWISWIDMISPEICFVYGVQIQQATIKMTTHSLKKWLTEMDQAIGKTLVLMKNSYPQKKYFWSTSQHPGLHYSRYSEEY